MKKALSIILSLVLVLCALPLTAVNSFALTDGEFEYTVENDEATITGYIGFETELTIPSILEGYCIVTGIGERAFYGNTSITSVTIPDSVTDIGKNAFTGCSSLISVTIPDSVTTIGQAAFQSCYSLSAIIIPDSVVTINTATFSGCTSLSSVTLGRNTDTIGNNAFYGCAIENLTIPGSVTSFGANAFRHCTLLSTVDIDEGVTSIPNSAFYDCTSLTRITIPESVTSIAGNAFTGCSNYTIYCHSDSEAEMFAISLSIPYVAFEEIFGFGLSDNDEAIIAGYLGTDTDVIIPSTLGGYPVTEIASYAFKEKTITSITIPDSVVTIGNSAFNSCTSLSYVNMGSGVITIGSGAFYGCTSLESIAIGSSVETINSEAFRNCSNLKSVYMPASLKAVNGRYAFYNCNSQLKTYITDLAAWCAVNFNSNTGEYCANPLETGHQLYIYDSTVGDYVPGENIVIPNGVTAISAGAFRGCQTIISVTIPSSVTSIGYRAFDLCSDVETFIIANDNLTSVANYGFNGCSSIDTVKITDLEKWCNISFAEEYSNPMRYGADLYVNGVLDTVTIPGMVTNIKQYALEGINNSVVIPGTVTTIGNYAFYRNNSPSITIQEGVQTIGAGAFEYSSSLTGIVLPNSLTTLGNYSFAYSSLLEDISIGNSLTVIGDAAFRDCTALESIVIPDNIVTIGSVAFGNCTSLSNVEMGDGVTTIGGSAFSYCTSLESIVIGSSVETINSEAFRNCSNLKSVYIPASLKTINGRYAFYNCNSQLKTYITDLAAWCAVNFNSNTGEYCSNPLETGHQLYLNGELVEELIIPDGVTAISAGAFRGCQTIISVTIPESVTSIGYRAFDLCSNVKNIIVASNNATIGNYALNGCNALEHICCYKGSTAADFNSSKTAYLGDMNSDGDIDINDIGAIMSASVDMLNGMTELQEIVADYNLDGAVDGFDVSAIDRDIGGTTPDWTSNSAYFIETAGTFCVINNQGYNKVNNTKALAAVIHCQQSMVGGLNITATLPLLVSTDPDAVAYTCSGKTYTYETTVTYHGLTWYVSSPLGMQLGSYNATSLVPTLPGVYPDNMNTAALALLQTANPTFHS